MTHASNGPVDPEAYADQVITALRPRLLAWAEAAAAERSIVPTTQELTERMTLLVRLLPDRAVED